MFYTYVYVHNRYDVTLFQSASAHTTLKQVFFVYNGKQWGLFLILILTFYSDRKEKSVSSKFKKTCKQTN